MKTYDWTVVGAGITGAALSYELAKKGFSVLLLEQHPAMQNATRLSYAGVAYWAGTTELTRQLSAEGIALLRTLSEELDANILFRELDLLLTVTAGENPEQIAAGASQFAIPPRLISVSEACALEPLLNPESIAGALTVRHGHVQPESLVRAYCQAFIRAGGAMQIAPVSGLLRDGNCITGVTTPTCTIHAANVAICAGGITSQSIILRFCRMSASPAAPTLKKSNQLGFSL
jgi:glycine/D-amino acid oxidase-like deaminating enzyme